MKDISYRIIRSNRRTISIEISPEAEVVLRCPWQASDEDIRRIVEQNSGWIEKHLSKKKEMPQLPPFTGEEIEAMADKALAVIPMRVAHFAPLVGVSYGRITIRNQRTKWGSCSSKGNLNFNCVLMLAPAEVVDYIVVHELCHRKEMNHSPRFWAEVERVLPDYKASLKWLKENGGAIIERL